MGAKAGVYVRISKDIAAEGLGVARQEADCRELAAKRGWEVAEVYSDNDLSATSGKPRPAWERLLEDLKTGKVQAVIAYSSSRMYRKLRDLTPFLEIAQAKKVKVATVVSGDVDLTTADGRMLANILASIDQGEAERISERIRRKLRELAETGQDKGGPRPFGYGTVKTTRTKKNPDGSEEEVEVWDRVTIRASEAEYIRKAAKDLLEGKSLRAVAAEWNEAGLPSASGKVGSWSRVRVRQILTSPRVAGLRQSGRGTVLIVNGEPVRAEWDPILDQESWLKLRSMFGREHIARGRERAHLLTGLVYCSRCGSRMEARPAWKNQPRAYVCRNCSLRIGADGLDEYVMRHVFPAAINAEWIRRENARVKAANSNPTDLRERHKQVSASLVELSRDFYVRKLLERDAFEAANAELTAELEQLEEQLSSAMPEDPYAGWDTRSDEILAEAQGWNLDRKHRELATLLERIEVHPASKPGRRGFDESRVKVLSSEPWVREAQTT